VSYIYYSPHFINPLAINAHVVVEEEYEQYRDTGLVDATGNPIVYNNGPKIPIGFDLNLKDK